MSTSLTTSPPLVGTQRQRIRRARLTLTGIATAIAVVALGLILLTALLAHRPPPGPAPTPPALPGQQHPADGWDWPGETALAASAMPLLAPAAAHPQDLAATPNPRILALPSARATVGPLAYGLPGSGEGATAALSLLDETGLRGGDPRTYAAAYQAASVPGSPPATQSRLFGFLSAMRASAGLPNNGPVEGLTITYQVMQGQVKGLRDAGRYAVVCVLGELAIDYHGRLLATGVSDCQALRYLPTSDGGGQWRISPGTPAAHGADAWPGSDDSFRTGYLEVQR